MKRWLWISLSSAAIISMVSGMFFGAATLPAQEIVNCISQSCTTRANELIFWQIRLPRVLIGFLVGAGLAIAGATLQNITRNDLADPYLFGVVAGAGLGASIALVVLNGVAEGHVLAGISLPFAAFVGALCSVLLVHMLSMSAFARRTEQMLLAGVAISFMLSAISQFLVYLAEPFAANQVVFWLMGSLARAEAWYVWLLLCVVTIASILLLVFAKPLDALLLGDENAKALGVNVKRLRALCLILCAALTSCIVAYCGGIGFVGLMIPHIVRRWLGPSSRTLTLGCLLLGGIFMVWVDVFARTFIQGQEIPIGIITSAIGGLFFIIAMYQRSH